MFYPVSARGVAERTPSFMYPQGTASSQMVLRGMDLLLECIASGVYVCNPPPTHTPATPPPRHSPTSGPPLGGGAGGLCMLHSCHIGGGRGAKKKQTASSGDAAHQSPLHPILLYIMSEGDGWLPVCVVDPLGMLDKSLRRPVAEYPLCRGRISSQRTSILSSWARVKLTALTA